MADEIEAKKQHVIDTACIGFVNWCLSEVLSQPVHYGIGNFVAKSVGTAIQLPKAQLGDIVTIGAESHRLCLGESNGHGSQGRRKWSCREPFQRRALDPMFSFT